MVGGHDLVHPYALLKQVFEELYDYCCAVAGASLHAADRLCKGEADVAINWGGGRYFIFALFLFNLFFSFFFVSFLPSYLFFSCFVFSFLVLPPLRARGVQN